MAPKFDWDFTCTQEYRMSELKNKEFKVLNTIAIANGYAGRDPQGGTSDGSFLVSSLLSYKEWLKFFFCSLKEKRKISYRYVKKKVVNWEDGENRKWIYTKKFKRMIIELGDCGVGDLNYKLKEKEKT